MKETDEALYEYIRSRCNSQGRWIMGDGQPPLAWSSAFQSIAGHRYSRTSFKEALQRLVSDDWIRVSTLHSAPWGSAARPRSRNQRTSRNLLNAGSYIAIELTERLT
jgi:hypothetical protein